MNKLQDWLGEFPARCALLLYLSVGLLQLWIIPSGLESWLGLHWMVAVLCAAVLAWIPVFGQALGLAVAVYVLNWPVSLAVALFLWPVWLVGAVYAGRRFTRGERGAAGGQHEDPFKRGLQTFREGEEETPPGADEAPPHLRTARQL